MIETLSPELIEHPTPDNLTLSDVEAIEFDILLEVILEGEV